MRTTERWPPSVSSSSVLLLCLFSPLYEESMGWKSCIHPNKSCFFLVRSNVPRQLYSMALPSSTCRKIKRNTSVSLQANHSLSERERGIFPLPPASLFALMWSWPIRPMCVSSHEDYPLPFPFYWQKHEWFYHSTNICLIWPLNWIVKLVENDHW